MAGSLGITCILHGSFRKDLERIRDVHTIFTKAGITVLAPEISAPVGETDGFVHLAADRSFDPRVVELLYLRKLSALGPEGFSYYVNPDGILGISTSYELAMDQLTNTRSLFLRPLRDHPAYVPENSVWEPEKLAEYITHHGRCPPPFVPQQELFIQQMLQELILPGSVIAVGGIIVDYSEKRYQPGQERDVLLVQTHKWGGRFSIVGGKVQRNERLAAALQREIHEETGLDADVGDSICTFDELSGSGYFMKAAHRVFTDNVVSVRRRAVRLNEEAEAFVWMSPTLALRHLPLEPNARKTLALYQKQQVRIA